MPNAFCAIGAAGTDKYGHKIAIRRAIASAVPKVSMRTARSTKASSPSTTGRTPVSARSDTCANFKDPEGSHTGHVTKDYMIIELVPRVTLSSQGPYLKQTGEVKAPGGTPSPNALKPALDTERLLAPGAPRSSRRVTRVCGTGPSWATPRASTGQRQGTGRGYSGGPAIARVPRGELPSQKNGFKASGPWGGITKGITLALPPFLHTRSANILADLRARDADAAPAGVFGAGSRRPPTRKPARSRAPQHTARGRGRGRARRGAGSGISRRDGGYRRAGRAGGCGRSRPRSGG